MPIATYKRVQGNVGLLQLDDGGSNAFGHEMLSEAYHCLVEAEKDLLECKGALVIAGNQRILSSGFDLGVMAGGPEAAKVMINEGAAFIEKLVVFPRPVVVAATGHAVALGAFVLLCGDYRFGADSVKGKPLKVGLNETGNGMNMPEFFAEGARAVLAPNHLREAVSLGLIVDAPRAQVIGFLDEVVPHDKVLETALAKAEYLAGWCKHPAFQNNKHLLWASASKIIAAGRRNQAADGPLKFLHPPSKL